MFGFIFSLILLYFVYLLIAGIIRFYRWRDQARKHMEDMRRGFSGARGQHAGQASSNPWFNIFFGGNTDDDHATETRRKRIDPEVGEYVNFTETKDPTPPSPRAPYRVEEQIVDIEWEEIK